MRKFFTWTKGIRFRFFVFFVMANILFGAIVIYSLYSAYYGASLTQMKNTCQNYIEMSKTGLSSFVGDIFSAIHRINNDARLMELLDSMRGDGIMDRYQQLQELESLLKKHLENNPRLLALTLHIDLNELSSNTVSVTSDEYFNPGLLEGNERWLFNAAHGDGKILFRPPYQTYTLHNTDRTVTVMSFFKLLRDKKNRRLAVLSIETYGNTICNILQNISVPDNTVSYVVNSDGVILASSDFSSIGNSLDSLPALPAALGPETSQIVLGGENRRLLVEQQKYYFEDWRVITVTLLDAILRIKDLFYKAIFSLLFYLIVFVIVMSLIMTKLFTQPINRLVKSINTVRAGDLSSRINIVSHDEIGQVQKDFNNMMDSIQTLVRENYEVKLREKEAQIKSMEAQINPHFLYNTLDTINWKAYDIGGKEICKMITSLSQILRYSIGKQKKVVPLEEEIKQINNYLFIQQIRYRDHLHVNMDIAPETLHLQIYKLLLQPIVENAIIHGLAEKEENGVLRISTYIRENRLLVEVYDNGKGIAPALQERLLQESSFSSDGEKSHIGINNVHNRLKFYYGEQYGIIIESEVNRYTRVILQFPAEQ